MLKSKAIKGSFPYGYKPEMGWIFWIKEHTIWKIESLWNRYTERIARSYAFAKIGWLNYDFDAHTVWELLEFKLKRIHPVLVNGHAVQKDEDMNALLEAIEICKRLKDEDYDDKYYAIHDAKWGELETNLDRRDSNSDEDVASRDEDGKPLSFFWRSWRKNANTEELKEQEREETRAIYENSHKDYIADLDRLNEIFKKHFKTWWD